jgi:membrane protein DedA with SNARE-associated domain
VLTLLERMGYLGVALFMFLENLFPPIPSEIIMPWAGFRAAAGDLSLVPVILAGSAGSLAGSSVWYFAARKVGPRRLERWIDSHGRWLGIFPGDLDKARKAFDHHGGLIVCVGRLIPGIRTLISVPAAFAGMPLPTFFFYSAGGTVAWTAALAATGWFLGSRYETLGHYVGHVATAVFILMVLGVIVRNVRHRGRT